MPQMDEIFKQIGEDAVKLRLLAPLIWRCVIGFGRTSYIKMPNGLESGQSYTEKSHKVGRCMVRQFRGYYGASHTIWGNS